MAYNKSQKLQDNIAAIKLVLQLSKEGRTANDDERAVLRRYSGFGGLKFILNPASSDEDKRHWKISDQQYFRPVRELYAIIHEYASNDNEERAIVDSVKRSVNTAFYTPGAVIDAIASVFKERGVEIRTMLDPSAGIGKFGDSFKQAFVGDIKVSAFEKDVLTGKILSALNPNDQVTVDGFETIPSKMQGSFDLATSNIPFGDIHVMDDEYRRSKNDAKRYSVSTIHNYFFLKALDQVREGGFVAFITSRGFMDSPSNNPIRQEIAKNARLVGAFRLPDGMFRDEAGTDVGSDLVVLQKVSGYDMSFDPETQAFCETSKGFKAMSGEDYTDITMNTFWWQSMMTPDSEVSVSTNMMRGTDPYGKPTLVFTHDGGMDGIAKQLKEYFSRDLHREYIDYYQEHAPKIEATVVEQPEQQAQRPVEDIAVSQQKPLEQQQQPQGRPQGRSRGQAQQQAQSAPVQLDLFAMWDEFNAGNGPSQEEVQAQEAERAAQEAARREAERKRLEPRAWVVDYKEWYRDGTVVVEPNTHHVGVLTDNIFTPLANLTADQTGRLRQYVLIRDAYHELYNKEAELREEQPDLREALNRHYDNFFLQYGRLNERRNARVIMMDALGRDGLTLENEGENRDFVKADIFERPVSFISYEITHVDTPEEALSASLNRYGRVNLEYMAGLTGNKQEEMPELLKSQIYYMPDGSYEIASKALSGNVYEKLAYVSEALDMIKGQEPGDDIDASIIPALEETKAALQAVIPEQIAFDDIGLQFGERWIPTEYYEEYIGKLFNTKMEIHYAEHIDEYSLKVEDRWNLKIREEFCVRGEYKDYDGMALLTHAFHNTTPDIQKCIGYDENGDDLKGPDMEKIQLANTKIEEIRDGFTEYLTNLPKEKRDELQEMYNRKFNCFVKAQYDGSYQTFPGIDLKALASPKFNIKNIYKSQKDCVKMILENGGGICDHEVGTGKSLIMCMAAHEMHRLGIANKPMIIAMKANVAEIAATYQAAFPDDKILYASEKDFSPANRVQFFSRIKNNDYACVIMSHDQFGKIPQAMEVQQQILQDEIRDIDEALDVIRQQGGNISGRMLTGLEKRKENMEVKLMELQSDMANRKDDFVDFARMGIDHIFIDESHQFKNLMFTTRHQRVSGLGNPSGSQKALNLLYAIRTIQNRTGKDLGATFLSGTTISNSLTELYLLFKYLRPEAMAKQGIHSFDAWAAVYAKKTSDYEFSVTNAVVQKERFRYFVKVPELATFYNEITDYRTGDDVGLDRPNMNVILHDIEPTADQKDFNERLVQFAQTGDGELIFRASLNDREMKGKMLIATDASRKASMDMRLVSQELFGDDPNNKASHCARLVSEYYQKFNEQKGTQFIFSDLSTYKPNEWNIFQEIKDKLVNDYGIPAEEVRFIQEASSNKVKQKMIDLMNEGKIRVLFGSTSTLGTGVNAQQRAVAVHHIDIPWRPSDLEQRNGRARRTGNWVAKEFAGNNVDIIIYAVKRTLDSYKFNLLQNKQLFITQLKTNQLGTRVIDEGAMDEENGMNFAEYVAILSGNDDLLQKAKLEKKIMALESERKTYMQARRDTEWRLENAREKLGKNEVIINGMTEDYERYQSQVKQGEDGTPLPGLVMNNVSEFTTDGAYNIEEMGAALQDAGRTVGNKDRQMGTVYGFPLMVDTIYMYDEKLRKEVYAGNKFYVKGNYLYEHNNGKLAMSKDNRLGAVRYGVNALEKIPGVIAQYQERNEKLRADIAEYERIAGKPWGKEDELKGLKKEMEALDAKIRESLDETTKNIPKVEEKPYKFSKEGRYHKVLFARDAYPLVSISEMREFADTGSWRNRGYVRCGNWDGDVMVSEPEVEGEFTLRQKAEEFIAKVEETNNERKNNLDWLIVKAKENTKGDKVHQDSEVIFAAREALQKQGVDWQNAQEPAKGAVPTQEELETERLLTLANTKDAHTLPLSDDLWHRARLMLDDRGIDWRTGLPINDVSKYVLKWRIAGDNQLSLYAQGVITRGRVFHPGDAAVLTAQELKQLDDAVGVAKSIFRNAEDRRDAYERLMVLVDYLGEQMMQRGEQADIQQPTDDALLPGAEFYQQYINEHFEGHSESAIIKLSNALVQITDEYTKMPDWYQRESILAQMRVQANRNLRANGFGGAKDIVELMMNHVMPQDQQRDLAKMRVYSAGQYGGTVMGEELRTIAHQVKEYGTDSSVRAVVDKMIGIFNIIPNEDLKKMVLIPMPGASGYPGYMEKVVNELGERTGLQTANSLFSTEHEPLYDLKMNGTAYEQLPDIKFEMNGTLPAGTIVVLVDNVLDTGKTLSQAAKADFGEGVEVCAAVLAHTDNYQEHNSQMEVRTIPQLREEMSVLRDQRKAEREAGYEAAVATLEISQQGADAVAVEEMKRLLNVSWNSPFGGKDAKEKLNALGVDWQTGEAIVSSAADHVSFQFVAKDYVSTVTDSEKDMLSLVAMDLMSGNYLLGRRRPDGYREFMAEIGGAFAAVKTLSVTARQRDLLVALSGQYHEGYAELASQADVSEDVLKEALSRVDGARQGVVTQIMTQPYHIYHEDNAFVLDYEHGFGLAGNLVEQVAKVHDGEIFERAGRKMVLFDSERSMQGFIDNIRTLNVTYTNDLRDTLIGRLRAAGISVNTDWQEGERVLAQVTGIREHQAYGFVHNGTIYIDPRIATAETPLHEYTHLWAEVLRQRNPKEWQNIVQMMKDTSEVWNYVKQNYPHLKTDDQIADEALAQFSGKRGYKKLQELVDGKQDADTIMGKMMEALAKFWNYVAEFFGIHYTNKEEVADRILYDLLNEVNPLDYKLKNIEVILENQESQIESDNFKKWFGDWHKPSIYRAYMVDDVAGLKDRYISELPNKFYDHSTVTYGLQAMDDREGQQKRMHIIGRLTTDKVDVLVVDNPESNNKYAHITLTTAEGVKPIESNAELEKHAAEIVPLDDYVDVTFKNVLNRNLSKVVDADGKPLAVEHGTHADFTVFDINKIGSNSKDNGLFGAGFYFGTHAPAWLNDGSEDYRNMKVFLDIKHPFEVNDKASLDIYSEIVEKMDSPAMRGLTITGLNGKQMHVGEYIDVINSVDDVIKHNPVHVNGQIAHDEELQSYHPKDRQRMWREHEISRLTGMGTLGMSWQVVISEQIGSIQFTEAAKKDGYDGVIVDRGEDYKEYVAFEPTQIKSASENVGLFNKENADIRFHFIGEQGAKNLDVAMDGGMYISNLRHAERLEKIGRSPLDIKIETGWERGADGQWRLELPSFREFDAAANLEWLRRHPDTARYLELLRKDNAHHFGGFAPLTAEERAEYERLRELPDNKYWKPGVTMKNPDRLTLEDYVSSPLLFMAYPELRHVVMRVEEMEDRGAYATRKNVVDGSDIHYIRLNKDMVEGARGLNVSSRHQMKSTIAHEVQHYIQEQEGFARGNDIRRINGASDFELNVAAWDGFVQQEVGQEPTYDMIMSYLKDEQHSDWRKEFGPGYQDMMKDLIRMSENMDADTFMKNYEYVRDNGLKGEAWTQYWESMGEVESRNVQARMGMTIEQRRHTLAVDTEDVPRERQTANYTSIIAASREVSERPVEPRKLTVQDREAGGALVDHLQAMGIAVHTDSHENRRVLKAAEKDQSEAGKVRHFKTETGESYGFSYKGEIHLDLRKLDAELPLHEYAHLFCQAMQRVNPDNWNRVVGMLKQDVETWDAVKRIYPELTTDNDITEEVIAQYSGKRGAEKLQAELERMTPKDANYGSRWGNIYQNVAKAIQDFWKHIGDSMNIEYSSKEDIADQILNDFAKNVNPVKKMERWLEERDKDYAAAVERGDTDKARELFNAALQENIGNGVTPFVAVDGYRGKMDRLARAVKEGKSEDLNEAAILMSRLVPDNAVLVPAPSHEGLSTYTRWLANRIRMFKNDSVEVADVLRCYEHESQYAHKKATGKALTADELRIYQHGELPEGKFPVVIDNVVNTGNTAEACIKALGKGMVLTLASATSQERHVASLKSANPIVYDKQGQLIPLSERFELKNKWLGRVMNYKPLDGVDQQLVVKEPDIIQGLEGYSVDDVKSYVENSIDEILEDAGLSDDITIKNITVVGSRSRGEAHEGSDLDILVEYEGDFREDALFDILHEEGIDLEGIAIDINPINPHYSLTTEEWLARDAQWREEDRQKAAVKSGVNENVQSKNIRSMQTSVIKSNLQVLADRLLPGTQSRVRFLKPQDPDRPSAVGGEICRREDGIHVFRENQDVPLSSIDDHNELTDLYRSLLEYSIAERIGNGNGMNFSDSPNIDGYEISVAAVVDGNLRVMGTRDGDQANNSSYITMEGLEELIGIIDKRVAEVENIRDFDAVALHESNYQAFALAASAMKSKVNEPNILYDNIIAIGDMPPTVEHLEEWASEQMDLLRRGDADSVRVNELSNGKYRKFLSAVSAYLPEEDVKRLIDGIAAQRNTYSENHIIDQYDKVISHYQVHAPEGALADDVVSLLAAKDGVALMNWVRDSHNHDYSEPLQQLKAMLSTKTVYQADQITAAIQDRDLQVDHRAQVERSLPKTPIEQSYAFVMGYYINNVSKMSEDERSLFRRLDVAHSADAYQRWASDVRVGGALQGLSDMPDAIRADVLALANQIIETKDDVLKNEVVDALDGIGIVNQFRKDALAQQYDALKAQYPDETILFRNGQGFSVYGDDVNTIQDQTGWLGQTIGDKGQQFRWLNLNHDGYNVLSDKELNLRVVTPTISIRPLALQWKDEMGASLQTIDYSLSLGGEKPVLIDTDGSLVISDKDSDFKVKTLDFHSTGLTAISEEGKEMVIRDIPKNYYHPQGTLVVVDYINGHRQTIEHSLEASRPVSSEIQAKQTQLLASYKDVKAVHENETVLFRQKGFLEAFGQDADRVAEKFGVPVYERNIGGEDVHFVMIPTEKYASALEDGVDLDLFVAKAQVDENRRDIRSTISLNEQIAVEHGRAKLGVSVTPIDNEGRYQIEVFNPDTKLAYDEPMELSKEDAEKFRSLEGMEHLSERSDLVMALADKYFSKELEMSDARSQVTKTYDNMGMSYTPLMLLQTIDFKPNQTAEVEHYNAVSVDPPYIMLYETMDDAEKSMSPRMLTDLSLDLQQSVLEQLKGGMFNEMQQEVAEHFEQPQEQHINIDDQLERVGQELPYHISYGDDPTGVVVGDIHVQFTKELAYVSFEDFKHYAEDLGGSVRMMNNERWADFFRQDDAEKFANTVVDVNISRMEAARAGAKEQIKSEIMTLLPNSGIDFIMNRGSELVIPFGDNKEAHISDVFCKDDIQLTGFVIDKTNMEKSPVRSFEDLSAPVQLTLFNEIKNPLSQIKVKKDDVLAEVKEKISQTENKEYSPDDVAILKEAAIAHIEKYNSNYYQAKGVDIKGMIESSEVTGRHSLSAAVASVVFDIHSEALGRESGILERLLPNDMGRADETFTQSRDASAAAEAILDLRQNNLKDALDTKVAEVNTTLAEYNRLSQASDPNFMLHSHVENYALEQQSENEFALTDPVERKFATSWMGARELLAYLANLLQKMFEKFPELKPSHEDKVEESPEQHVDAEEQAHAEKSDGEKKTSKWDNLDYTKYVLPEGADVTHKRWKFIKPKDGEQYGKYHIMCDFKGKHYEREMYGNDIKAFFEKDETGQRTNRVTLDQLVAKYFGKQFAEAMSIGSVQEAEHVLAEQKDAKDQTVADKENEAAQRKAAEEKKAAEEAAKKKAEKKEKVPTLILQSSLLVGALLAAKENNGVWLNKDGKAVPVLHQSGTPVVSAFNGLMMALHSDAHGYKSNDYTTFNAAKSDGYHVKGGESGLPFNWYKWDKYVNRFNANEVIDKAAYDALAPEEKELYKVQRIKEERSIFNIDQTTMPEVKKDAYRFILEAQEKDSVYRGAEESAVQPVSLPKQFRDLKEKHPDSILLMRDGNSYNLYGDDADKLSGLLGLEVKDHDPEGNEIKFAAFPYHALDINLPKMIRAGHRVAICDQIGDIRSSQRHGAADAIYNKAVALEDALVILSGNTNKVMKEPFFDTAYDGKEDTLRFADRRYYRPGNEIVTALQRVNDSFRAAAAYTGGESRLNRVAYSTMLPGDTEKYDRLVSELAAGVLMSRAGLPATLSKESMALVPYWERELKESPKLMESVERDVNNAVEVLEKIKAGETVDYAAIRGEKAFDAVRPKLYTIANELASIPDATEKHVVIVKDQQNKSAAVILPAGASLEVNNEITGLNKNRFLIALRKQGFENVQFYNAGGALGLNQSNEFFADKTVEVAKLKQYDLQVVENIDLSEEIERSLKVDLEQVQVTFDDNMHAVLYVKPVDGESFTVYPEPSDVKLFFDNVRSPEFDSIRENLGQKYYGLVARHPDLKTDVLMPKVSADLDLSRISKVNITKDRYKPESTIIFATIDGRQQKPIELSQIEAQRYWLVDDKNLYKLLVAAQKFEEQLHVDNGQSEGGQGQFHDSHEGSGVDSSSPSAEVSAEEDKQERKGGIRM